MTQILFFSSFFHRPSAAAAAVYILMATRFLFRFEVRDFLTYHLFVVVVVVSSMVNYYQAAGIPVKRWERLARVYFVLLAAVGKVPQPCLGTPATCFPSQRPACVCVCVSGSLLWKTAEKFHFFYTQHNIWFRQKKKKFISFRRRLKNMATHRQTPLCILNFQSGASSVTSRWPKRSSQPIYPRLTECVLSRYSFSVFLHVEIIISKERTLWGRKKISRRWIMYLESSERVVLITRRRRRRDFFSSSSAAAVDDRFHVCVPRENKERKDIQVRAKKTLAPSSPTTRNRPPLEVETPQWISGKEVDS